MLTGAKHMLSRVQRDDFCSTGTAHIFAISGLHIGVIALFFDWLFRLCKVSRRMRAIPVVAILFLYLSVIGPMPSSTRAYTMLIFYYAAIVFRRRPNVFSSLANSAAVNVFCDPWSVFNVSFLLSYGIVFGIICVGTNLSKLIRNVRSRKVEFYGGTLVGGIGGRIGSILIENLCVTLAASIASLPMSAEFFGNFSYLTVLLNLILVPLASVTIMICSASLLFGIFNMFSVCALINNLALLPVTLINFTLDCSRKLGHGLIKVSYPLRETWIFSVALIVVFGWLLAKLNARITHNRNGPVPG
jgi:competence protein ComEC